MNDFLLTVESNSRLKPLVKESIVPDGIELLTITSLTGHHSTDFCQEFAFFG